MNGAIVKWWSAQENGEVGISTGKWWSGDQHGKMVKWGSALENGEVVISTGIWWSGDEHGKMVKWWSAREMVKWLSAMENVEVVISTGNGEVAIRNGKWWSGDQHGKMVKWRSAWENRRQAEISLLFECPSTTNLTWRHLGVNPDFALKILSCGKVQHNSWHELLVHQDREDAGNVNKTGKMRTTQQWGAFVQPLLRRKRSKYYTLWVCVCSLMYIARNAHAPYYHPWPARLYSILPHYLINGRIFEKSH